MNSEIKETSPADSQVRKPNRLINKIIETRKQRCGTCSCSIDFSDLCASCPHKKWGPMGCVPLKTDIIEQTASFPKPSQIALNFSKALKDEFRARIIKSEKITQETAEQRYSICEGCEFFHAATKRCQKCGCYLKWKTAWRSQKCPIGKW